MAPILEVLGPLLVAAFISQSPEDQQQNVMVSSTSASASSSSSTSSLTVSTVSSSFHQLMLNNSPFRNSRAQKLIHGLFCSSSTNPYNHLSFAGDAAGQMLVSGKHVIGGGGFRDTNSIGGRCLYSPSSSSSMFASAFTPSSRTTATARNSALFAVAASAGNGMIDPNSFTHSKLHFVTSSVLSLVYDINGGGSGSPSTSPIGTISTSLLQGIQQNANAFVFMVLLALQFGLQPILTKKFTPKSVNRSTIVLTQEIVKFIAAGCILIFTGAWTDAFVGMYTCMHNIS